MEYQYDSYRNAQNGESGRYNAKNDKALHDGGERALHQSVRNRLSIKGTDSVNGGFKYPQHRHYEACHRASFPRRGADKPKKP